MPLTTSFAAPCSSRSALSLPQESFGSSAKFHCLIHLKIEPYPSCMNDAAASNRSDFSSNPVIVALNSDVTRATASDKPRRLLRARLQTLVAALILFKHSFMSTMVGIPLPHVMRVATSSIALMALLALTNFLASFGMQIHGCCTHEEPW